MKTLLLVLSISVLTVISCSKRDGVEENCDDYYITLQKERWKKVSACGTGCFFSLGKGIYKSSVIYFTDQQCIYWNTAPKTSGVGVNCAGDSIRVDNWNEVKNLKQLATCADK